VAVASLITIATASLFVLGAAEPATVSFQLTSYSAHGHDVVIYGNVTDGSHDSVANANVVIYRSVDGQQNVLAQVATHGQGFYRFALNNLSQSTLRIQVSSWLQGRHYVGKLAFWARPGQAYDVSASLLHRSSVFFLPIWAY
jgi:hypothetical protein